MLGRRTAARPGRSPAAALRALLALVVLLALCVGIPMALVALTPTAFPHGVPGSAELWSALTRRDDGTLFLAVLTLAAWVGWAAFAVAVLLEIPAQLRGVPAVRVRGLGVQQSLAGGLVTAVLAMVLVPSAAGAAVRPPVTGSPASGPSAVPVVAEASAAPGAVREIPAPSVAASTSADSTSPSGAREVHVVRPGDTLWDLAAEHLGDGSQWRRIADLNYDRAQPGGGHLDRRHTLQPGWRLEMPVAQRAIGDRATEHVVRRGETLSGIAEHELGDASRYPELSRATQGVRQPDGRHLTDPDRIYPGWHVMVPGAHTAPGRAHIATPGNSGAEKPGVEPLDPSWGQAPEHPSGDARPELAGRTAAALRASATTTPSDRHGLSAADGEEADVLGIRTVTGTGGLLAASLVALLGARRARQRHRRRPGERIPLPAGGAAATEAALRAVADPAGLSHVDLALRNLAAAHRADGGTLPALRAARLTASHLELYLTEVATLPSPWIATSDPTVWAMTHEELRAWPEVDMRAPYPALVTVGHDLEGAHVLVDLERVTALGLEGSPTDTLPVLAALAVELATSPWADDLLVTLVGCLPELPSTVATGRLRHVERVEQLVADLEGRALDVERVLRESGVEDLGAARGTGLAHEAWSPEIVLMTQEVPPRLKARLEEVLYRVPRVGLAAVTGGTSGLGEWRLRLEGDGGFARLDPPGLTLRPQRLAGAEYEHVLDVMRLSDADPVPGPDWGARLPVGEPGLSELPEALAATRPADVRLHPAPAPDVPTQVDASRAVDLGERSQQGSDRLVPSLGTAPAVRLFGPVTVVGATGPEPVVVKDGRAVANHLGRATALVAFLACTPEGATTEQVGAALSPVRRLSPATIWSLASRTRKWLGNDPDGVPYYPRTPDAGAHRLHPAVRTDWSRWVELVGDDAATTPTERLVEALELVSGRPFDGVVERHYAWAEPVRQEMTAAVVDVAHEVARRALTSGDAATARQASRVGRRVDPVNELLWRDGLRAEYVAGNREAQRRLVDQLLALADELDGDLEPETEQLLAELESRATPARAAP
jgi:nucleoid-associated protein YgaU